MKKNVERGFGKRSSMYLTRSMHEGRLAQDLTPYIKPSSQAKTLLLAV